jgi:cold shock protein
MAQGTVKWFNPDKGYGFIKPDDGGQDVFVHMRQVERAGMRGLNEGQRLPLTLLPIQRMASLRPKTCAPSKRADCLELHLTALAHRGEMFVLFLVHGAFPFLGPIH